MKVYKFGGASVKSADGIRNIVKIVSGVDGHLFIVVSAMGKTTNAMEVVLDHFMKTDKTASLAKLQEVEQYHAEIIGELFAHPELGFEAVKPLFDSLKNYINTAIADDYDRCYDYLVSYGELISTRIVSAFLQESGVTNTVDPLGGSFFVEAQTDRIEKQAYDYFRRIEEIGGVIPAIEKGFFQGEIAEAAYRYQREIDLGGRRIVGVNAYAEDKPLNVPILKMDPDGYERQVSRLNQVRKTRDNGRVGQALEKETVLPVMQEDRVSRIRSPAQRRPTPVVAVAVSLLVAMPEVAAEDVARVTTLRLLLLDLTIPAEVAAGSQVRAQMLVKTAARAS